MIVFDEDDGFCSGPVASDDRKERTHFFRVIHKDLSKMKLPRTDVSGDFVLDHSAIVRHNVVS